MLDSIYKSYVKAIHRKTRNVITPWPLLLTVWPRGRGRGGGGGGCRLVDRHLCEGRPWHRLLSVGQWGIWYTCVSNLDKRLPASLLFMWVEAVLYEPAVKTCVPCTVLSLDFWLVTQIYKLRCIVVPVCRCVVFSEWCYGGVMYST